MSYAKFSEKFFQFSYQWRSRYFWPILKLLDKMGVKPNDVTFFRLFFVLPLIYFLFININLYWTAFFYTLFWLIDTLDGALARYQNNASDRGKFLDVFVDAFMYSFLLFGLINAGLGGALIFAYQILIHGAIYILAIVKKQEGQKSDWLIKPWPDLTYLKFTAHAVLVLAVFFNVNFVNSGFLVLNVYMTILSLYYFYVIYKRRV